MKRLIFLFLLIVFLVGCSQGPMRYRALYDGEKYKIQETYGYMWTDRKILIIGVGPWPEYFFDEEETMSKLNSLREADYQRIRRLNKIHEWKVLDW